jgi:hypothetical protein
MCFLTSDFDAGYNSLAPYELALMDAYAQVGRIDLAWSRSKSKFVSA